MTSPGRMALAAVVATVYAICYSAIKLGLPNAPPLWFGGLRAVIAGATLLALLPFVGRSLLPPRRLWPGVVALATIGTAMAYAAMFSSPGRTGAGLASVQGNTTPLIVIAIAVPVLGEQITPAKIVALLLGLTGAFLIAYSKAGDGSASWGIALPLLAAAGFAISSVIVKSMDLGEAVLVVAAWQFLLGGAALLGASALAEPRAIVWQPTFVLILLFLGVIGTALTTTVWYWLLQREEVSRLSMVLFLEPAMGLGLALLLFDERLALLSMLGIGLIFLAFGAVVIEPSRAAGDSS